MRILIGVMALAIFALAQPSYTVEPAYTGQFGNAEEPALRPYKWLYHGVKSLLYHTGDQFVEGNLHTPGVGSVQVFRGVRRGTLNLGESLYRGGVFAPVPPRGAYKDLGTLNTRIEQDMFLRNGSDLVFSWYFFPAQKAVDYYPIEGDTKVSIRQREAREVRQGRRAASDKRKVIDPNDSDVKRAQRSYIGARADYGNGDFGDYRGNLMKLAR